MSKHKQYGLILAGQQQKKPNAAPVRELSKPSIFNESSDSSDNDGPQMKMKAPKMATGPGAMERRMARQMQAKALAEDPTVYQYDELYDEIEAKREEQQQAKSNEPKKPKYIGRLVQFAERRKLENELRIERQVQKEREAEGEQFKDKEAFVTETYRKKLEEMRKLEEEEKRDEYLEAIGDVTKQKDLDGFYRHLFEQKLGTGREVQKPDILPNASIEDEDATIAYKPIKSGKPQQRAYRKRQTSDDENDTKEKTEDGHSSVEVKKVHLQNNMDADSDFSIDSSDSESEDENNKTNGKKEEQKESTDKEKSSVAKTDPSKIALNLGKVNSDKENETTKMEKVSEDDIIKIDPPEDKPLKSKRDKIEIWKKRTVGDVFDAAVQRYYERKAARNG